MLWGRLLETQRDRLRGSAAPRRRTCMPDFQLRSSISAVAIEQREGLFLPLVVLEAVLFRLGTDMLRAHQKLWLSIAGHLGHQEK